MPRGGAHEDALATRLTTLPVGPYQTSWPGLRYVVDWYAATLPWTLTITGFERRAMSGRGWAAIDLAFQSATLATPSGTINTKRSPERLTLCLLSLAHARPAAMTRRV